MEPLPAVPWHALLSCLQRSVQDALVAGHVGVPVFVRCVAQASPDPAGLTEALDQAVAVAGSWLGAPARRVYVQGSASAGQITTTLEYAGGQSALVSVSPAAAEAGEPRIDLLLLGSSGALYHEGSPLSPAQLLAADTPSAPLPELPEALRHALEQSLSTGAPVSVRSGEAG
jgi:hypothetical protein